MDARSAAFHLISGLRALTLLTAALKNCNPFYCFRTSQLWKKGEIAVKLRKRVITNFMIYALRLKNFLLVILQISRLSSSDS
jgi:hypothetical protein